MSAPRSMAMSALARLRSDPPGNARRQRVRVKAGPDRTTPGVLFGPPGGGLYARASCGTSHRGVDDGRQGASELGTEQVCRLLRRFQRHVPQVKIDAIDAQLHACVPSVVTSDAYGPN